ncbi:MAG: hypothetical protein IKZ82_12415 [Clostridia bacterium]|nr:hypothetical protein [Clostridia bacterium]
MKKYIKPAMYKEDLSLGVILTSCINDVNKLGAPVEVDFDGYSGQAYLYDDRYYLFATDPCGFYILNGPMPVTLWNRAVDSCKADYDCYHVPQDSFIFDSK